MGDDRDDSRDSRLWGFLPRSHIEGRPLFIYMSFATDPIRIRWIVSSGGPLKSARVRAAYTLGPRYALRPPRTAGIFEGVR